MDYHETQFLEQLNKENHQRIENPQEKSQSDSINSQAFDRYAYANNNPIRYNDPTGHRNCEEDGYNCSPFNTHLPEDEVGTTSDDSPNPPIGGLVTAGIVLTVGVVLGDTLLTWAEIALAPTIAAAPVVGVPLEAVLISTEVTLTDIDISYWSYTYRVHQNPNEIQQIEFLPPWGLGKK